MLRIICWVGLSVFIQMMFGPDRVVAQLPPNQPEQDCINAIPICLDTIIQNDSYVGEGLNPEEINSAVSCLATGEENDVWYIFTVQQAGLLAFTLTPNDLNDDYDYAVYNLTNASCSDIRETPELEVSCNFAEIPGPTGPNGSGAPNSGDPFPVIEGETYVINISNFDETNSGYMLDFSASTAVIFDDKPAEIVEMSSNCATANSTDSIRVRFSENIQCNELAGVFTLTGPEGEVPISSVNIPACNEGAGFTREVILTIEGVLMDSSEYSLSVSGNAIVDNCGNISSGISFSDFLNVESNRILGLDTVCEGDTVSFDVRCLLTDSGTTFATRVLIRGEDSVVSASISNGLLIPISRGIFGVRAVMSGTYTFLKLDDVTGTDEALDSVLFEVTVLSGPKLDLIPEVTICGDGPGVIIEANVSSDNNAPLPFTYQWLPEEGVSDPNVANPFVRPDTSITYRVVATAFNGCKNGFQDDGENEVLVRVQSLPTVQAPADTAICQEDTIQLMTSSGVVEGISYAWTPLNTGFIDDSSSANPFVSPEFTTTYFVSGTANGCQGPADSITVIVNITPTISAGEDRRICLGDSVELQGIAFENENNVGVSFEWFPSSGLADSSDPETSASPDTTREYQLIATTQAGCESDTASVMVEIASTPIANILTQDTTLCTGDTIALRGAAFFSTTPPAEPLTFNWEPNGQLIDVSTDSIVRISPGMSVDYILTTSIGGSCPTADTVSINVVPGINASVIADTNAICAGDSLSLQVNANAEDLIYRWFPGDVLNNAEIVNPIAFPDSTTTFVVAVTDGVCVDTAETRIEAFPTPGSFYLSSRPTGCVGLEVTFEAEESLPASFVWDFGDGSPVSNHPLPTHVYDSIGIFPVTLTATGVRGCSSTSTIISVITSDTAFADAISDPLPDSDLFLPLAEVKFNDRSRNGISYVWDFGDGSSSTEPSPMHTFITEGTVNVLLAVTDENDCVDSLILGPFNIFEPTLFIPNVFSPNQDDINDTYMIQYEGSEQFRMEILDRWGKRFFESDNSMLGWDGTTTEGEEASEGVYFYRLKIGVKEYRGNLTLLR